MRIEDFSPEGARDKFVQLHPISNGDLLSVVQLENIKFFLDQTVHQYQDVSPNDVSLPDAEAP